MMQEANVSHGKTKMDKLVRRRGYHAFIVLVRCAWQGGRGTVPMSIERKKVMKKQKRSNEKDLGKSQPL
jgi:hypothetical protein